MKVSQAFFIRRVSDLVLSYINNVSIEVAEFIACQSAVESGYGTSTLALEDSNIFGMKMPNLRLTSAFDKNVNGFAVYDDIYLSIIDYLLWLSYNHVSRKSLRDVKSFSGFLVHHHYCDSDGYIPAIQACYDSYQKYKENEKTQ